MSFYWQLLAQHSTQIADLKETVGLLNRMRGQEQARLDARIDEDVGALGLALMGLIGLLIEKGLIKRDELLTHLRRVDEIDGVTDGRVTPEQVRVALGIAPSDPPTPEPGPDRA